MAIAIPVLSESTRLFYCTTNWNVVLCDKVPLVAVTLTVEVPMGVPGS